MFGAFYKSKNRHQLNWGTIRLTCTCFHVQRKNLFFHKINFSSLPRVSQLCLFLFKNRSGPASKFVSNLDFFGNYFFNNFKKPSPSFQRADPPNFVPKSSTPSPPRFKISSRTAQLILQSFHCFSVFCHEDWLAHVHALVIM